MAHRALAGALLSFIVMLPAGLDRHTFLPIAMIASAADGEPGTEAASPAALAGEDSGAMTPGPSALDVPPVAENDGPAAQAVTFDAGQGSTFLPAPSQDADQTSSAPGAVRPTMVKGEAPPKLLSTVVAESVALTQPEPPRADPAVAPAKETEKPNAARHGKKGDRRAVIASREGRPTGMSVAQDSAEEADATAPTHATVLSEETASSIIAGLSIHDREAEFPTFVSTVGAIGPAADDKRAVLAAYLASRAPQRSWTPSPAAWAWLIVACAAIAALAVVLFHGRGFRGRGLQGLGLRGLALPGLGLRTRAILRELGMAGARRTLSFVTRGGRQLPGKPIPLEPAPDRAILVRPPQAVPSRIPLGEAAASEPIPWAIHCHAAVGNFESQLRFTNLELLSFLTSSLERLIPHVTDRGEGISHEDIASLKALQNEIGAHRAAIAAQLNEMEAMRPRA
ncbi:MAG: hypothetical protein U1F33_12690 [Alphaproteobacteria bacterium]